MARVLICAALAVALSACSVVPEYGRARPESEVTPPPSKPPAPSAAPPVTYEVTPFEIRTGASSTSKTVIAFSNPNPFLVDWSMVVRLKDKDGGFLREERIGSAGVPPDRWDTKFQNWYFPLPPGDSWAVVRFETSFGLSDVQKFTVERSLTALTEVSTVRVSWHSCYDSSGKGVGCELTVEALEDLPALTKLHLVVVVLTRESPHQVLRALQWRPELAARDTPWLSLRAGGRIDLQFQDNYATPSVPWEYRVLVHAYQFASGN